MGLHSRITGRLLETPGDRVSGTADGRSSSQDLSPETPAGGDLTFLARLADAVAPGATPAGSAAFDRALFAALFALRERMGWPVACVRRVETRHSRLDPAAVWSLERPHEADAAPGRGAPDQDHSALFLRLQAYRPTWGRDPAGRAAAEGSIVRWSHQPSPGAETSSRISVSSRASSSLLGDATSTGEDELLSMGLRSALAFAILHAEQVVGVVELYSPDALGSGTLDDAVLRIAQSLLARVFERERLERDRDEASFLQHRHLAAEIDEGLGREIGRLHGLARDLDRRLSAEDATSEELASERRRRVISRSAELREGLESLQSRARSFGQLLTLRVRPDELETRLAELAAESTARSRVFCSFRSVETDASATIDERRQTTGRVEARRVDAVRRVALDELATTQLYRLARSGVGRALRRGARRIVISLESAAGRTTSLLVEDDAPATASGESLVRGGWRVLDSRARSIGASLELEPGDPGTRMRVRLEARNAR